MKTPRALDVGVSASSRSCRFKFKATASAAKDSKSTNKAASKFSKGGTPKDLSPAKPKARTQSGNGSTSPPGPSISPLIIQ